MNICIYEDFKYNKFFPLVLTRPVFDLKSGFFSSRERICSYYNDDTRISLLVRSNLAILLNATDTIPVNFQSNEDTIYINGKSFPDSSLLDFYAKSDKTTIYECNDCTVAVYVSSDEMEKFDQNDLTEKDPKTIFKSAKIVEVDCKYANYVWDLLDINKAMLLRDFANTDYELIDKDIDLKSVNLINPNKIVIGKGSKIKPGVVLDAEKGPVFIGKNVEIESNAVICGPVYIGNNSTIRSFSKIYDGVTIGEFCKIGGEVEGSIIQGYSNKQHSGFLGHSYLGEWVNLGADTNTSDLKNNYGSIKLEIDGNKVDTGKIFLGSLIGDHSKTGINTMLNTGTIIGIHCNLFGGDFMPRNITSFSWGGSKSIVIHDLKKALITAQIVMKRRGIELSEPLKEIYNKVYEELQNLGEK